MRGYSKTPRVSEKTFLILDRLYGTLHDKIEEWAHATAGTKGCCGVSEKDPEMIEILKQRLLVAYDLSSAFNYLHGHKYVQGGQLASAAIVLLFHSTLANFVVYGG